MSVVVIIPARYASTRLPGKPLLAETGKPLIRHTVEAVRGARKIDRVVVATDDERIARTVRDFEGEAVLTRSDHTTGTDRLTEAVELLNLADDDIVVNVQGDEPDMPPELVDTLVDLLTASGDPMATLCVPLPPEQAKDPNKVKVLFDANGRALYFSRAMIPYDRQGEGVGKYYLHLGIYAYRVRFLKKFARLEPTDTEQTEKLEQLRALENGYPIAIQVVRHEGHGIDTPEDYAAFVEQMNQ